MMIGRSLLAAMLVSVFSVLATASADETKLPTDEAVRTEMKAIRDLTLNAHTLVTHRRMPLADARTFHARVTAAVERIDAGTTLTGTARDEISTLTGGIAKGAAAVAGAEQTMTPIDGIIAIDAALSLYARRFDHPGWQPLR